MEMPSRGENSLVVKVAVVVNREVHMIGMEDEAEANLDLSNNKTSKNNSWLYIRRKLDPSNESQSLQRV
jgi:hypothetical protein